MKHFLAIAMIAILAACQTSSTESTALAGTTVFPDKGFTTSGYPYEFHKQVDGPLPEVGSRLTYHQMIWLNDSSIYSSYIRLQPKRAVMPALETLPDPIPPDYEALMMMSPGDCMTVVQTLDTFSVDVLPRGVTNKDTFTYTMKLVGSQDSASTQRELLATKAREKTVNDTIQTYLNNFKSVKSGASLQKTNSGLLYQVVKKGNGAKPESGQFVKVHYSGHLQSDGSNFDNTFKDGQPFTFRFDRGQVIEGWDEMIGLMNEGDQVVAYIPFSLAYGVAGRAPKIPEKADLIFFIELEEIVRFSNN